MAIYFGVAYPASNGYAGQGVVAVTRLLDCLSIRETMRKSGTDLALIVSDGIYSDIVFNRHTSFRQQNFRRVAVRVKEFAENAWIWLPHGDVHSLSIAEPGHTEPGDEAPESSEANRPAPGEGHRAGQGVSVQNNFNDVVIAPGSTFGIDQSGR